MQTEAHIIVRGIVQGVCFRMETQRQARRLGVAGYVRNLPSGDVEILVQGPPDAVERVVAWARHGPPAARVDDVNVSYREPTVEHHSFNIR